MFNRLMLILFFGILPWTVTIGLLSHFTAHYEYVMRNFKVVIVNSYYLGCLDSENHMTYAECRERADKFWTEELLGY